MTLLVTGGAGFIGSHFVLDWLSSSDEPVVNLDALTYAGHRANLAALDGDPRHIFVHGDVTDRPLLDSLLTLHRPRAIVHFAAESHVDRSIHGPAAFVRTNVEGSFTLLEAARAYWQTLDLDARQAFRFHQVSTDEATARSARTTRPSPSSTPTRPTAPTPPARPQPTTSFGPGTAPTDCRCSSRTAATTTGRCTSRRS